LYSNDQPGAIIAIILLGQVLKLSNRQQSFKTTVVVECTVTRRRFPVGASPTRQPLQPKATGAVMEDDALIEIETLTIIRGR
jgi:hypothetical protein